MTKQTILRRSLIAILGTLVIGATTPSVAFNMGDMMNPSKWMGGGRNRDGGYDDGPYGGPGYGYGGPGYGGYGGGPGYGGYGGGPGYGGYGGGPGYGGYGGPEYGYGGPGGYGGGPGGGYPGGYGSGAPGDYGSAPMAPPAPTGTTMPVYGTPSSAPVGGQSELDRLRNRVRELEGTGVR
jgi:hypothetical protein